MYQFHVSFKQFTNVKKGRYLHSMFLEWWNTAKCLSNILQNFSCLIDMGTAKICKKFNFHDCFLRADQGRAKNCCQIGWIGCPILQVAQKATMRFQISFIFLQSPHQVDMKNVVKWYKHFFCYFNALKTQDDELRPTSKRLILKITDLLSNMQAR